MASATPRDLATAHDGLLADKSIQFGLPPAPPPPKPPAWIELFVKWLSNVTEPIGHFFRWIDSFLPDLPVVKAILWVLIAAVVLALIWLVVTRLRSGAWRLPWRRDRAALAGAQVEEDWQPDSAPVHQWLEEADALAAEGRFGDAVHHLLFRSVDDIARRRPRLVRPAVTSRELAAADEVPANARRLFGTIAAIVERGLFAGRPIGEPDWTEARVAYADFALAKAWRA